MTVVQEDEEMVEYLMGIQPAPWPPTRGTKRDRNAYEQSDVLTVYDPNQRTRTDYQPPLLDPSLPDYDDLPPLPPDHPGDFEATELEVIDLDPPMRPIIDNAPAYTPEQPDFTYTQRSTRLRFRDPRRGRPSHDEL